jgi:hypothetical protein
MIQVPNLKTQPINPLGRGGLALGRAGSRVRVGSERPKPDRVQSTIKSNDVVKRLHVGPIISTVPLIASSAKQKLGSFKESFHTCTTRKAQIHLTLLKAAIALKYN